ncbi:DUF202 domain-containing protein [Nocardia sp. NPDC050406]|uniref:DUF202 domain-containing protein n=1 Tax=Nocardia sp. NPDC050406 TaxID=3364318 RepID=UPI0037B127A1
MRKVQPSEQGLAAERTALSWRRTAMAAMANAVLFLHAAADSGWRPADLAPLAAVVVLSAVVVIAVRRGRILHTEPRDRWGDGRLPIAVVTISVIGVTCVAAGFGLAYARFGA